MATVYNSIVRKFLEEHSDFKGLDIVSGLYTRCDTEEIFVFECAEWKGVKKTFVFIYDCGHFVECRTEQNTFGNYLMVSPWCCFMELVRF